MIILVDENKLSALLANKKDQIGIKKYEGADKFFAAISLIASCISATYASIGPISGFAIKCVFIVLSIIFGAAGVYEMIQSVKKAYSHDQLLNDIKNINEVKSPYSLVAIKDSFNDYPNRFLLYYDLEWECWFFPNFKTIENEESNIQNIRERISNSLKVDVQSIDIDYKTTEVQYKISPKTQNKKCYNHRVYVASVEIKDEFQIQEFESEGRTYRWMSIDEMKKNPEIKEKNMDVVCLIERTVA